MKPKTISPFAALAVTLALIAPAAAQAQVLPYDGGAVQSAGNSVDEPDSGASDDQGDDAEDFSLGKLKRSTGRLRITPYIEAQQVVTAQLSPVHETLT